MVASDTRTTHALGGRRCRASYIVRRQPTWLGRSRSSKARGLQRPTPALSVQRGKRAHHATEYQLQGCSARVSSSCSAGHTAASSSTRSDSGGRMCGPSASKNSNTGRAGSPRPRCGRSTLPRPAGLVGCCTPRSGVDAPSPAASPASATAAGSLWNELSSLSLSVEMVLAVLQPDEALAALLPSAERRDAGDAHSAPAAGDSAPLGYGCGGAFCSLRAGRRAGGQTWAVRVPPAGAGQAGCQGPVPALPGCAPAGRVCLKELQAR